MNRGAGVGTLPVSGRPSQFYKEIRALHGNALSRRALVGARAGRAIRRSGCSGAFEGRKRLRAGYGNVWPRLQGGDGCCAMYPKGKRLRTPKGGLKRSEPHMAPGRILVHRVHNPSACFMHDASHNDINPLRLEPDQRIAQPEN